MPAPGPNRAMKGIMTRSRDEFTTFSRNFRARVEGKRRSGARDDRPRLRLISFRPFQKNSLIGFATVELPIGLRITDVLVLTSRGKAWASPAQQPVLGADGKQAEVGGKRQYANILEWRDRNLSDGFTRAVDRCGTRPYPGAFDGDDQ